MTETQPHYGLPSKSQTQIQVNDSRENSWKRDEKVFDNATLELRRCGRIKAIAQYYQEQYDAEMAYSKHILHTFGSSQKARFNAEIFKAKSNRFANEYNVAICEISRI